ncbi:MAG: flagellar basal-body MS-ring/collar protein FliF [Ilumatobacteraceae bacterium]
MKETIDNANTKWRELTFGQRFTLILGTLAVIITGYVVYQKVNQPNWAVLEANVDDATASKVLAGLDAHGIAHKVDGNGTRIMVPKDQLDSSRLALAGDGITAQPQPEGFDQIFAAQGLASSDFEQRVNYQRALEGELARTLLTMEPVAGARVALSIPQPSIFIGDGSTTADKPTASVVLSLRRDLTRAESDTIANVIGSSVEGLTPDQVTIASADGTLLRAAGADQGATGSTTHNIDATREFETGLSARLTDLARTLSGQPNAKVEVRAVLDFTESTVEKEVIDPTKNTPTAEHETTEKWTGSGGTAGGVTGADGGPLAASGSSNGTYDKTDKTTTYTPGDRTVTKSTTSTPSVTRLSVAVVVPVVPNADGKVESPVDADTLTRVLGPAAGIDTKRGDTIEVAVVPAAVTDTGKLITATPAAAAAAAPKTTLIGEAAGGGAFFMLVVAMMMRRRRKKKERRRTAESPVTMSASGGKGRKKGKKGAVDPADGLPAVVRSPMPTDPDRQAVDEIKGDLERMLNESPESLTALLSTWMAK